MSRSESDAPGPITAWVRLVKPGYTGRVVAVQFDPRELVMSAITVVCAYFRTEEGINLGPSRVDLFLTTKAGVEENPPTFIGAALRRMELLSAFLPSPLPSEFAFLAVVEGGACVFGAVWIVLVGDPVRKHGGKRGRHHPHVTGPARPPSGGGVRGRASPSHLPRFRRAGG